MRGLKRLPCEDRLGMFGADSVETPYMFKGRLDKAFEHPHLVGVVLSQDSGSCN